MNNERRDGLIFVLISALVFSSAGLFTKGVEAAAADVVFWRGLAAAAFTFSWLALTGKLTAQIRALNGPAWLAATLMAAGTAAFIPALKLTSIAHVALIYAACPFIAAALAWLMMGERPSRVTMSASLAALAGVAIIMAGSDERSGSGTSLQGDVLALVMTTMMAAALAVYRRWPATPAALPAGISSLILVPFAAALGNPADVAIAELPVLIAFGLVFALASVTLSEGARRLPAAEVALISALETPIAPLLAWLFFASLPGPATWLGGAIIFAAVLWSQIAGRAVVR
ncbi:MAG: DMT family transporter [Pseudomonadota bacterium]